MNRVFILCAALALSTACDKADTDDTGDTAEIGSIFDGTVSADWWLVIKGNPVNTLDPTATCGDPDGTGSNIDLRCYDCFNAEIKVYGRWLVDNSGRTYETVMAFYDNVNVLTPEDGGPYQIDASPGSPHWFEADSTLLCVPAWLALGE